jgi:hypothetical protein
MAELIMTFCMAARRILGDETSLMHVSCITKRLVNLAAANQQYQSILLNDRNASWLDCFAWDVAEVPDCTRFLLSQLRKNDQLCKIIDLRLQSFQTEPPLAEKWKKFLNRFQTLPAEQLNRPIIYKGNTNVSETLVKSGHNIVKVQGDNQTANETSSEDESVMPRKTTLSRFLADCKNTEKSGKRQIKMIDNLGSSAKNKQVLPATTAEQDKKSRLQPKVDDLNLEILSWDFASIGNDRNKVAQELGRIPDRFTTPEEYQNG